MNTAHRRWRPVGVVVALGATAVMAALLPRPASADAPLAGSAGFPLLPATDSAMSVSGRGLFTGLKVTVGQTKGLINQAVQITWKGGRPTPPALGSNGYTGNYLQMFQCWGDPDGTVPDNPGPPPETCEQGGAGSIDAAQAALRLPGFSATRVVGQQGLSTYDPTQGFVDPANGIYVWKPFRAVDGTEVGVEVGTSVAGTGQNSWLNPFYDANSTNEIPIAATDGTGAGSAIFTMDTGLEANGLGCGQKLEKHDGTKRIPRCWLVVVPRGTAAEENPPEHAALPLETSPLSATAWKNRISFPLDFTPIDSSCNLGADARRIAGSELATPAVSSWQPVLCATPGSPPYNYASISDGSARRQLLSGDSSAAGMAVMSRPVDPAAVDPANPVVYAPVTLSGVTIGFNMERNPDLAGNQPKDPAQVPITGTNVADIRLTPRLVAKLLTESYQTKFNQLNLAAGGRVPKGYEWYLTSQHDLLVDPDFRQFNPEFANLKAPGPESGYLVVEQPTSDAAYQLWRWILADPEATTWLAGTPDRWGMKVNPFYSTDPKINPTHQPFADPVPDGYPQSDPFCYQDTAPLGSGKLPRPHCLQDVAPFANNMSTAAAETRTANIGSLTGRNEDALSPDTAWIKVGPEPYPNRGVLSMTDTASAARFGLQMAKLSSAGADTANRSFVAPDPAGLLAGAKAMTPSAVPEVLQPDPAATGAGAYPLTMVTYAAVTPRSLAAAARPDYAAFVTYAVGKGQVPGQGFGQLPPGYAPLPSNLVDQAKAAAVLIANGDPAPPAQTTTTSVASATGTAGPAAAVPGNGSGAGAGNSPAAMVTPADGTPRVGLAPITKPTTGSPGPISRVLRTIATGIGGVRYTLPIAVVLAIVAGAGAFVVRKRRRNLGAVPSER